jgi:hypothetical protein
MRREQPLMSQLNESQGTVFVDLFDESAQGWNKSLIV